MILIVHKDDCNIAEQGPSHMARHFDMHTPLGGRPAPEQLTATLCTCGGVKVELMLGEQHGSDTFKAIVRFLNA